MILILIFFVVSSFKIINCTTSIEVNSNYFKSKQFNSNYFNSNYFNSNYFNSNYFNSNHFNSNYFNSNYFNSNHFSSIKLVSYTYNNYISIIPNSYTFSQSIYRSNFCSSDYSLVESITRNKYISILPNSYIFSQSDTHSTKYSLSILSPTIMPTTMPPTVFPNVPPTLNPSLYIFPPTLFPSIENLYTPSMSFETIMTLSGLTEPTLDDNSKTAFINTIAKSINISTEYVFFKGQTYISNRKLLALQLLSTYDITVITEIIIPLIGKYNINPTTLYSNLVTNLKNSIISGNFILFLRLESILLNSSTMLNVIVSNYTVSQMTLVNPTISPTINPTSIDDSKITGNLSQKELLIILFVSIGVFIGILISYYLILHKINRPSNINLNIRSNISSNDNSINIENIVISINHNE